MKLIKEEKELAFIGNQPESQVVEVEEKDTGVVGPVYADAVRQMKKADEKRKEYTKIPNTEDRNLNPKFKGSQAQKKLHLSESLFEEISKDKSLITYSVVRINSNYEPSVENYSTEDESDAVIDELKQMSDEELYNKDILGYAQLDQYDDNVDVIDYYISEKADFFKAKEALNSVSSYDEDLEEDMHLNEDLNESEAFEKFVNKKLDYDARSTGCSSMYPDEQYLEWECEEDFDDNDINTILNSFSKFFKDKVFGKTYEFTITNNEYHGHKETMQITYDQTGAWKIAHDFYVDDNGGDYIYIADNYRDDYTYGVDFTDCLPEVDELRILVDEKTSMDKKLDIIKHWAHETYSYLSDGYDYAMIPFEIIDKNVVEEFVNKVISEAQEHLDYLEESDLDEDFKKKVKSDPKTWDDFYGVFQKFYKVYPSREKDGWFKLQLKTDDQGNQRGNFDKAKEICAKHGLECRATEGPSYKFPYITVFEPKGE